MYRIDKDSPVEKFLRGLMIFHGGKGVEDDNQYRKLLESVESEMWQRIMNSIPKQSVKYVRGGNENIMMPYLFDSALIYDSVVLAALTSCSGSLYETELKGAIGYISLNECVDSKTCSNNHSFFRVLNVRSDPSPTLHLLTQVISITESARYMNNSWEDQDVFIYSDGSTIPPSKLRLVDISRFEANLEMVFCIFCFSGLITFLIFAMIVHWNKDSIAVKIVRPIFLYMLLFWSITMMFAILALFSRDCLEDYKISEILFGTCIITFLACYLFNPAIMVSKVRIEFILNSKFCIRKSFSDTSFCDRIRL